MRRKISTIILMVVVLGIVLFYNSNDAIEFSVEQLPAEAWELKDDQLINIKNDTEIIRVYAVNAKGHVNEVELKDYYEILKLTQSLTDDISNKVFPESNRDDYKAYEIISYEHLSHVEKISVDYKDASMIKVHDGTLKVKMPTLSYGNFNGGVTLPGKLIKHVDYDEDEEQNISIKGLNNIEIESNQTVALYYKAFLDSSVILSKDKLMIVLGSFQKDVLGFIEVRSYK